MAAQTHGCPDKGVNRNLMSALKVRIESLSEEWEIEVKEAATALHLLIIRSKYGGKHTEPGVWSAQVVDRTFLPEIHHWIQTASENPHRPERITILDGTRFTISFGTGEARLQLLLTDFEEYTNEYCLVEKLLDSCVRWTGVPELVSLRDSWKEQVFRRSRI